MPSIRRLSGCLALLVLSACAGYKLGPTNGLQADAKTIQINPFPNQTIQPRLGDALAAAMRKSLQHDGTYRLSTHGNADVIVTGVITDYSRGGLSFVPSDVLTVRDFRVSATVQVTARDAVSGKVFVDRKVTGYTLVRAGADLTSAERQALPLLAEDLARRVTALLVDGSW
jgi:hypothetical protein